MEPIKDVWDMEVLFDDEVKQSFYGNKTRTIKEVLLGTKKYMEDKRCQILQCAQEPTVT